MTVQRSEFINIFIKMILNLNADGTFRYIHKIIDFIRQRKNTRTGNFLRKNRH